MSDNVIRLPFIREPSSSAKCYVHNKQYIKYYKFWQTKSMHVKGVGENLLPGDNRIIEKTINPKTAAMTNRAMNIPRQFL